MGSFSFGEGGGVSNQGDDLGYGHVEANHLSPSYTLPLSFVVAGNRQRIIGHSQGSGITFTCYLSSRYTTMFGFPLNKTAQRIGSAK